MQKLFGENYNRDKNYENIWSAQVLERQPVSAFEVDDKFSGVHKL